MSLLLTIPVLAPKYSKCSKVFAQVFCLFLVLCNRKQVEGNKKEISRPVSMN